MAIDDLVNKGKDFLEANKDKIDEALHSEQAEQVSDSALDAAAKFAKTLAPEGQQDPHREDLRLVVGCSRELATQGHETLRDRALHVVGFRIGAEPVEQRGLQVGVGHVERQGQPLGEHAELHTVDHQGISFVWSPVAI